MHRGQRCACAPLLYYWGVSTHFLTPILTPAELAATAVALRASNIERPTTVQP